MNPRVSLVGAGPGDPGLLTLRGAALLACADVVLYDGLCNPAVLDQATDAELICVGKHGESRIWTQEEINQEIIARARRGQQVVRLKGGDPAVFARTAEETEALRAAAVDFEIVPGITAALAASSYAGIPITHRRWASAVALVTGHEQPGKLGAAVDWDALARFPGTIVVYMGVTTASTWTAALLCAGKPGETPAAILRRCSMPDQTTIHCRLDEVADQLTPASKLRPPVIVIIGDVTRQAEQMSWFDRRPLFGLTVLVTRPADQADELSRPLQAAGAEVLLQPAIEIGPPRRLDELDERIGQLAQYDWVVFSSRNGVRYFLDRLLQTGRDTRALAHSRLAAVGRRTAEMLGQYHLVADLEAAGMNARSLAEALVGHQQPSQRPRYLLVRASRGPETLGQRLEAAGGRVTSVVAYQHSDVATAKPQVAERLQAGTIHWVSVTSDAIARSLDRLFGRSLGRARLAALSPGVAETLHQLGHEVATVAAEPTMQALVDAICQASHHEA